MKNLPFDKIISLGIAVCALITAYVQHEGKAKAESSTEVLIEQQNEIIKRYEEEAKRNAAIIEFLDSIARANQ